MLFVFLVAFTISVANALPEEARNIINGYYNSHRRICGENQFVSVGDAGTNFTIRSSALPSHAVYRTGPYSAVRQDISFMVPKEPEAREFPLCLPTNHPIGIAVDGVPFYSALTPDWHNAIEGGCSLQLDRCHGRVDSRNIYHYREVPDINPGCLDLESRVNNVIFIGVALDGFPIYYDRRGNVSDLDECGGKFNDPVNRRDYRYFLSNEYPYTIGCFRGNVLNITTLAKCKATDGKYGSICACVEMGSPGVTAGYTWLSKDEVTIGECARRPYVAELERPLVCNPANIPAPDFRPEDMRSETCSDFRSLYSLLTIYGHKGGLARWTALSCRGVEEWRYRYQDPDLDENGDPFVRQLTELRWMLANLNVFTRRDRELVDRFSRRTNIALTPSEEQRLREVLSQVWVLIRLREYLNYRPNATDMVQRRAERDYDQLRWALKTLEGMGLGPVWRPTEGFGGYFDRWRRGDFDGNTRELVSFLISNTNLGRTNFDLIPGRSGYLDRWGYNSNVWATRRLIGLVWSLQRATDNAGRDSRDREARSPSWYDVLRGVYVTGRLPYGPRYDYNYRDVGRSYRYAYGDEYRLRDLGRTSYAYNPFGPYDPYYGPYDRAYNRFDRYGYDFNRGDGTYGSRFDGFFPYGDNQRGYSDERSFGFLFGDYRDDDYVRSGYLPINNPGYDLTGRDYRLRDGLYDPRFYGNFPYDSRFPVGFYGPRSYDNFPYDPRFPDGFYGPRSYDNFPFDPRFPDGFYDPRYYTDSLYGRIRPGFSDRSYRYTYGDEFRFRDSARTSYDLSRPFNHFGYDASFSNNAYGYRYRNADGAYDGYFPYGFNSAGFPDRSFRYNYGDEYYLQDADRIRYHLNRPFGPDGFYDPRYYRDSLYGRTSPGFSDRSYRYTYGDEFRFQDSTRTRYDIARPFNRFGYDASFSNDAYGYRYRNAGGAYDGYFPYGFNSAGFPDRSFRYNYGDEYYLRDADRRSYDLNRPFGPDGFYDPRYYTDSLYGRIRPGFSDRSYRYTYGDEFRFQDSTRTRYDIARPFNRFGYDASFSNDAYGYRYRNAGGADDGYFPYGFNRAGFPDRSFRYNYGDEYYLRDADRISYDLNRPFGPAGYDYTIRDSVYDYSYNNPSYRFDGYVPRYDGFSFDRPASADRSYRYIYGDEYRFPDRFGYNGRDSAGFSYDSRFGPYGGAAFGDRFYDGRLDEITRQRLRGLFSEVFRYGGDRGYGIFQDYTRRYPSDYGYIYLYMDEVLRASSSLYAANDYGFRNYDLRDLRDGRRLTSFFRNLLRYSYPSDRTRRYDFSRYNVYNYFRDLFSYDESIYRRVDVRQYQVLYDFFFDAFCLGANDYFGPGRGTFFPGDRRAFFSGLTEFYRRNYLISDYDYNDYYGYDRNFERVYSLFTDLFSYSDERGLDVLVNYRRRFPGDNRRVYAFLEYVVRTGHTFLTADGRRVDAEMFEVFQFRLRQGYDNRYDSFGDFCRRTNYQWSIIETFFQRTFRYGARNARGTYNDYDVRSRADWVRLYNFFQTTFTSQYRETRTGYAGPSAYAGFQEPYPYDDDFSSYSYDGRLPRSPYNDRFASYSYDGRLPRSPYDDRFASYSYDGRFLRSPYDDRFASYSYDARFPSFTHNDRSTSYDRADYSYRADSRDFLGRGGFDSYDRADSRYAYRADSGRDFFGRGDYDSYDRAYSDRRDYGRSDRYSFYNPYDYGYRNRYGYPYGTIGRGQYGGDRNEGYDYGRSSYGPYGGYRDDGSYRRQASFDQCYGEDCDLRRPYGALPDTVRRGVRDDALRYLLPSDDRRGYDFDRAYNRISRFSPTGLPDGDSDGDDDGAGRRPPLYPRPGPDGGPGPFGPPASPPRRPGGSAQPSGPTRRPGSSKAGR